MSILPTLAATYSIAAVDGDAGLLGVAVQSHYYSVGSVVPWVEPGVGAIVTQSIANADFGPRGLELLRSGFAPATVLDRLLENDDAAALRQVAVMSVDGRAATHTGHRCIAEAGHLVTGGVSAQSNMMDRSGVPEAIVSAFTAASGVAFADRLLIALRAAELGGGDIRGRQSAAIVVVRIVPSGRVVTDRPVDLRVEDDPDPLTEVERLLRLRRAYDVAEQGDTALRDGDRETALDRYRAALATAPEKEELRFRHGIATAESGDIEAGRRILDELEPPDIVAPGRWRRLAARLPQTGMVELDSRQWDALLSPVPGLVYHVLTAEELRTYGWDPNATTSYAPDVKGAITADSLEAEGFIHCSFRYQIEGVLRRHYPSDCVVALAEIDPEKTGVTLRVEDSYGIGEAYPHLYGAIPIASVSRIIPLRPCSG